MDKIKQINKAFIRIVKKYVTFLGLFIFSNVVFAQNIKSVQLEWEVYNDDFLKIKKTTFKGAALENIAGQATPVYSFQTLGKEITSVQLNNQQFELLSNEEVKYINEESVTSKIDVVITTTSLMKKPASIVSFYPIIKENGKYKKLVSCDIEYIYKNNSVKKRSSSRTYVENSVLKDGDWYKFGVAEEGVYKITYAQLENAGIPINNINPQKIAIFGNGGGILPYDNSEYRPDDIQECAIKVIGEEDGSFDNNDYILFYGQHQDRWIFDGEDFTRVHNIFEDTTYYFIRIGSENGKRITSQSSLSTPTHSVTYFVDYYYHEFERVNLIKSGATWLGESFEINTSQYFSFDFENIATSMPVEVKCRFAAASVGASSSYTVSAGNNSGSYGINSVTGSYGAVVAHENTGKFNTYVSADAFDVNVTYNKSVSSAEGWLDFINVIATRNLTFGSNQLLFRDTSNIGDNNIAGFKIGNASAVQKIWDITENNNVVEINFSRSGSEAVFNAASDTLRQYVAFSESQSLMPTFIEKIENQNLHALAPLFPNYIIVTHPDFLSAAKDLADFHGEKDGLSNVVVTTNQVFNEFSSGAQDITAIKDFVKMFYDQAGTDTTKFPKYLLLFGDGSYDYKDLKVGNTNFVPVYQSANSYDPIGSYASDDYFGLLDDDESHLVSEIIDIGIGRFPVQNAQQAAEQVAKVKAYYDENTMRSWRNWITFVGDDEDGNLHMSQADDLALKVAAYNPTMNIDKIYLDAYPQVAGAGGNRYPQAADDIDRRVENGTLLMNYVGHGGELGWAHERVLENSTINTWSNLLNMPVFLTATCEFSRFDDPDRTSAGEYVLLNNDGGAIALLTTTRLVFSHLNKSLMDAFYDYGFKNMNNGFSTLGELSMLTKQLGPKQVNTRNFSLLGDPAIKLAYPKYNVVSVNVPDTIKALSKVSISGEVRDENGILLSGFNGIVYPTVFDKNKTMSTLNNEGVGEFSYQLQKNILFKGKASVTNGKFEFSFVSPKDIDFAYGGGKISYYAENGVVDASGYDTSVIIGGINENAAIDNQGPEIELYMNDESFVYGGTTNQNPILIAKFKDDNGINTTGNGVGHDIIGVLDENTMETIALNDFYEAELNDYTKGVVQYQLSDLAEGNHKIYVRAWDVYNNSGENFTEFIVASNSTLALNHVLNYPNPFTTQTSFYFEHNQPGSNLDVNIQIFTVSGKVVKTLNYYSLGDQIRVGPISWDGKDDFGDNIGKGVYVYRVSVKNDRGEQVDKFEKLVLLK